MSATNYQLGHRQAPPTVGVPTLAEDFGSGTAPTPDPPPTTDLEQARAELAQVIALQDDARYVNRDANPDFAWTEIGEASRVAAIVRDRLGKAPEPPPPPDPPPTPAPQFVSPLANGAVYGKTKWLPGSLSCDLFVPRGTPVVAPADCIIEEVLGGVGISGGDELILSLPDHSWAWRYRHTAATHPVGYRAKQGEQVGTVGDSSLDQLGNPPAWSQPMPDKYQHLDLSVNRGTDQFNPQGGGGGNVSAYAWMQSLSYQGRVLERTPGPPDAGRSLAESIEMMTPAGRR